jgi:hypothetical protein
MFKKILFSTALIAVIGVLVFGAFNRTQAKTGNESETMGQGGYGRNSSAVVSSAPANGTSTQGNNRGRGAGGDGESESELTSLLPPTSGELSDEETAALLYLREEEKLAHDVYVTLYSQWGLPIFQNISQSEQTHTDAVKALLDRYGVYDPASSAAGVFTNPDLQAIYTALVERGSRSLAEALKVGAAIEEIDILDLETRLAQTDNADIQQVFNNLMKGSYNHIRSFTSTLNTQTGEVYQPQYLNAQDYQAILTAGTSNGGNGSGTRRGRP